MPSEKMKYINRRMAAKSAMRTDIEMTPLKEEIEAIFSPLNIDDDCSTIDSLLTPLVRKVRSLLVKGETGEAITIFLEILESLSYHFIKDEHYCHFDDMYCPDYTCDNMMRTFIGKNNDSSLSDNDKKRLSGGIDKISKMEAYMQYGCPFCISLWEKSKAYNSGMP